jgi:peptidoglycan hydrolase-like protein with peptidoglycan-binding domain
VTINSGYRCVKHNKAVGGASKSKHLEGKAADIVVSGIEPIEVAKYAESIGVKGIGLYEWGCHIDTRTTKGFWYSSKQEPRTTFGGASEPNLSVLEWQKAAIADGFKFAKYGADGKWGSECEQVAKKAICKKRITYKYKNLTKLVQKAVGVEADGKFGNQTKQAVIRWQELTGLVSDGIVGLNTWKKFLGV